MKLSLFLFLSSIFPHVFSLSLPLSSSSLLWGNKSLLLMPVPLFYCPHMDIHFALLTS